MMKAIVKTEKQEGFEYQEAPVPQIGPHEVLVKVDSATICGSDVLFYHWFLGIRHLVSSPPFIPGHECGATVEEVGANVRNLEIGDRVAVETHLPCGDCFQCRTGEQHICCNMSLFGHHFDGCFAEFAAVPEPIAFKIRDDIDLSSAPLLEPMGVALRAVEEACVGGNTVAVLGAGPIGLFAMYLARRLGALSTVVVDANEYRLQRAKDLGADFVFDSRNCDLKDEILARTGGVGLGAIIEATGSAELLSGCFQYLRKGGTVVLVGNPKQPVTINNPIENLVQKEVSIKGIHGRRIFDTWEKTQGFLLEESFPLDLFVTHTFPMSQFEQAFQLVDTGNCLKVRLTP